MASTFFAKGGAALNISPIALTATVGVPKNNRSDNVGSTPWDTSSILSIKSKPLV